MTTRSGDVKVDLRVYGWFPAPGTIDIGLVEQGEEAADEEVDEVEGEQVDGED